MTRSFVIGLIGLVVSIAGLSAQRQAPMAPVVQIYKTPTCGCCGLWVKHLQENGFATRVIDQDDLTDIKTKHGVPNKAQSCHTAIVNGYVVEGHVPAVDVQRMLKERPNIVGIAVPGMPIGSPGMEVAGVKPQAYNVMAIDRSGALSVFAAH